MMKKLIIFGLLSCGPESSEEKHYDYSIDNSYGVTVEIIPYKNGNKEINNKVVLQNGEILNKKYTDHAPYGRYRMTGLFNSNTLGLFTHLEFVFKNSIKIIYEECSVSSNCNFLLRNIFRPEFNDEQTET